MLRVLRSWSSLRRPWSSPSPWSFSRGRISAAASVCARADAEGPSRVGGPGRGESPLCSTGLLSSLSPVGAIGGARTRIIDGFAGWVVRKVPSWRGTVSPSTSTQIVGLARSYSGPRGRTRGRVVVPWGRAVVPFHSRSYFGVLLTYDRAGSGTTARRNVRPRASGYDRAGLPTTARPIRARPARGARSDARRRAVLTGVPRRPVELDIPGRVGRRRRRTRAGMPVSWPRQPGAAPSDRSRCGTEPISVRN